MNLGILKIQKVDYFTAQEIQIALRSSITSFQALVFSF